MALHNRCFTCDKGHKMKEKDVTNCFFKKPSTKANMDMVFVTEGNMGNGVFKVQDVTTASYSEGRGNKEQK